MLFFIRLEQIKVVPLPQKSKQLVFLAIRLNRYRNVKNINRNHLNFNSMIKDADKDPRTFACDDKFYYVNFVDSDGEYDSRFSVKTDNKVHAMNRAKWHIHNKGSLSRIPYYVTRIVIYDSKRGYVCDYAC
jgi:hypothetical protein